MALCWHNCFDEILPSFLRCSQCLSCFRYINLSSTSVLRAGHPLYIQTHDRGLSEQIETSEYTIYHHLLFFDFNFLTRFPFTMAPSPSSSDSSVITLPDYLPAYLKYNSLQVKGGELQQQISNPNLPCIVQPTTLVYGSLSPASGWRTMSIRDGPPRDVSSDLMALGFPVQPNSYIQTSTVRRVIDVRTGDPSFPNVVTMHACEGVLTMDDISKEKDDENPPFTSQILHALYQKDFNISTLRYIYVCCVKNEETREFVTGTLYSAMNDLHYPFCPDVGIWDYGSPEYQALLGTRIGKVAAYLVLGAYPRGTKRIARIVTWFIGYEARNLQMRFDLENTQVSDA